MFKNNIFEHLSDEYLKMCLTFYVKYITFMQQVSDRIPKR